MIQFTLELWTQVLICLNQVWRAHHPYQMFKIRTVPVELRQVIKLYLKIILYLINTFLQINFKNSESLEISTSDESLSVSPYKVFKPPQCPYRKKHKHTIPRHAKSNAISESHCHCLDCGKGFTSSFDLLHHQKFMRLENNDWVCGCCGARFAERFQFYGRSDDDEFLNEECIHCQSQFATKTELNVHIITKHFTEKLQCDIPDCSSQFKQTDHFIRHLKTTHRQLDRKLVKDLLQKVLVLVPDYDQLKYVQI